VTVDFVESVACSYAGAVNTLRAFLLRLAVAFQALPSNTRLADAAIGERFRPLSSSDSDARPSGRVAKQETQSLLCRATVLLRSLGMSVTPPGPPCGLMPTGRNSAVDGPKPNRFAGTHHSKMREPKEDGGLVLPFSCYLFPTANESCKHAIGRSRFKFSLPSTAQANPPRLRRRLRGERIAFE